jgi:chromosome segregation ATPase
LPLHLLENHITNINKKLQLLLKNFTVLQKKCAQQEEVIVSLKQQLEEAQQKKKLLEEQHLILKSHVNTGNAEDKKAFEQVLNKYIKEIDKCITLLSE